MLQKYSKLRKTSLAILLPIWVFISYLGGSLIVYLADYLLSSLSFSGWTSLNANIKSAVFTAGVYILTLFIVIGLPWLIHKRRTTKSDLGFSQPMSWLDIVLSPAGLVVYLTISIGLTFIAKNLVPGFNIDQAQEVGFDRLGVNYEYLMAFIALVVVAPIAEETLFRGYLYGKLKKSLPIWAAVLITSLTFAAMHSPWNVRIDVFALSIVLCSLREVTGGIWSSILLHMIKNGLAFYFLYINRLFG